MMMTFKKVLCLEIKIRVTACLKFKIYCYICFKYSVIKTYYKGLKLSVFLIIMFIKVILTVAVIANE